jgi:hypothetical protein
MQITLKGRGDDNLWPGPPPTPREASNVKSLIFVKMSKNGALAKSLPACGIGIKQITEIDDFIIFLFANHRTGKRF